MVFTVDMVYIVNMVYTEDMIYTVYMVYAVDTVYTVYTVYTIQSALRGEGRSAPKLFPLFLKSWREGWQKRGRFCEPENGYKVIW